MNIEYLGFHTSIVELLGKDYDYFLKHKVFQVFIGSPRSYNEPVNDYIKLLMDKIRMFGLDIIVTVHSPYWVNMAKDVTDDNYINTLKYSIRMAKALNGTGINKYVTHVGSRPESMSVEQSYNNIKNFCKKWLIATEGTDTIMCLENDSGSKKGTKMGSLNILYKIVKELNNTRLGITFDSEHAYANGFDFDSNRLELLKPYVQVVHWNAIPEEVECLSHLDRHSSTSLRDSKPGVDVMNVYDHLYSDIPFIFEVKDYEIVLDNLKFIGSI